MVESTRADKVSDWTAKFEFLALPTFTVIFSFFLVFEKKIQSTASRQPWVFRLKKEIFPRRSRKPLNAYPILLCFERRTDERVFFFSSVAMAKATKSEFSRTRTLTTLRGRYWACTNHTQSASHFLFLVFVNLKMYILAKRKNHCHFFLQKTCPELCKWTIWKWLYTPYSVRHRTIRCLYLMQPVGFWCEHLYHAVFSIEHRTIKCLYFTQPVGFGYKHLYHAV